MTLAAAVAQFRRELILETLAANDGHVRNTAKALGINRTWLHAWLKRYRAAGQLEAREPASHKVRTIRRGPNQPRLQ